MTIGAGAASFDIALLLPLPLVELVAESVSFVTPPFAGALLGLLESVVVAELASFAGGLEVQASTVEVK
jgi:hypothetical protein